jgi:hypothetical protein
MKALYNVVGIQVGDLTRYMVARSHAGKVTYLADAARKPALYGAGAATRLVMYLCGQPADAKLDPDEWVACP